MVGMVWQHVEGRQQEQNAGRSQLAALVITPVNTSVPTSMKHKEQTTDRVKLSNLRVFPLQERFQYFDLLDNATKNQMFHY